jgi:hypothetical protein
VPCVRPRLVWPACTSASAGAGRRRDTVRAGEVPWNLSGTTVGTGVMPASRRRGRLLDRRRWRSVRRLTLAARPDSPVESETHRGASAASAGQVSCANTSGARGRPATIALPSWSRWQAQRVCVHRVVVNVSVLREPMEDRSRYPSAGGRRAAVSMRMLVHSTAAVLVKVTVMEFAHWIPRSTLLVLQTSTWAPRAGSAWRGDNRKYGIGTQFWLGSVSGSIPSARQSDRSSAARLSSKSRNA